MGAINHLGPATRREDPLPVYQTHEYLRIKSTLDKPYRLVGILLNEPYSGSYINERGINLSGRGSIEMIAMSSHGEIWLPAECEEEIRGCKVTISPADPVRDADSVFSTIVAVNSEEEIEALEKQLRSALEHGGVWLTTRLLNLAA